MRDQFFGKPFWVSLAVMGLLFVGAILSYQFPVMGIPLLVLSGLILLGATARHPIYGLLGVFSELFSNPHGQLFSVDVGVVISIRMILFVAFFLGFIIYLRRTRTRPLVSWSALVPFLPLGVGVMWGLIQGGLTNTGAAFQDGNAYFYFAYVIPILSFVWEPHAKRQFLQVLAAGAIWNILACLIILYLFSHLNEPILRALYPFLRDIRFAEITNLAPHLYRVFTQTALFAFVFGFMLLALVGTTRLERRHLWQIIVVVGGVGALILLSLSRSFWIGLLVGCLVLVGLFVKRSTESIRSVTLLGTFVSSGVVSVLLLLGVSLFPFPQQHLGGNDLAQALFGRTQSDVAISSRWMLLDPMKQQIAQHPILGSGFGTSVTFVSDDPRVREINPDGTWSTMSMEWGWLELWLKMGILGPVGYVFLLLCVVSRLTCHLKTDTAWVRIGLAASIAFLATTHFFSPYLNHPLGIGLIVFTLVFMCVETDVPQVVPAEMTRILRKTPKMSSVSIPPVEPS